MLAPYLTDIIRKVSVTADEFGLITETEGNNINALAISDLRNANLMKNGTVTISGFYSSVVGQIGSESSKAQTMKQNYELLVEQVDNARQSVQGVSLDEEMANLVKYQNAYDAAARVITVFDEALNTVISGMGIVGR